MRTIFYYLSLVLGATSMSFLVLFISLLAGADISTFQQLLFMAIIPLLVITPLALKYKNNFKYSKNYFKQFFIQGGSLSISLFLYVIAIFLGTPLAVAIFLSYTRSIFTSVIGKHWLKEDFTKRTVIALFLALLGIAAVFRIWEVQSVRTLLGPVLALLSGIAAAIEFSTGRFFGKKDFKSPVSFFWMLVFLLVVSVIIGVFLNIIGLNQISNIHFSIPTKSWALLGGLGISFIGYVFILQGFRKVPVFPGSVILLLEPFLATLLSVIFLSESLAITTIIGGILIASSSLLIVKEGSKFS